MKFFTTDKKEWKELDKEFKRTIVGKTISDLFLCVGLITIGASFFVVASVMEADLWGSETDITGYNLFIFFIILLIASFICRFAYLNFLYKFEKNKKNK